jgi:tRNA nucleotidyltransferase/poly(A) polymerase
MKIQKIEKADFDGEKIVVTLEEYPHAQPVFDANITAKDLETALKAWAVNQDAVDEINRQASLQPKPEPEVKQELKNLIGKTINE